MENNSDSRLAGRSFKKRLFVGALGLLLAVATGYGVMIFLQERQKELLVADANDSSLVSIGKEVYDANCASCHGAELQGEPDWKKRKADGTLPAPPHDETGHTWHHPDHLLFQIVRDGGQAAAPEGFVSGMPGFGEILSDHEIVASIAFIKSRWPEQVRQRQALISRQSRQAD